MVYSTMAINFVAGGRMGDLCERENAKASIALTDAGDKWKYGVQRAYDDCRGIVLEQPYVESFQLGKFWDEDLQPPVDLTSWRKGYHVGSCWSKVFSDYYKFAPNGYKWMWTKKEDPRTKGKVTVQRTLHRQNYLFPWKAVLANIPEDIVFVTSDREEWDSFQFKTDKTQLLLAPTISEMAIAIGSSKLFIGTQSCPMALACAFEVPRLIEIDYWVAQNSMDEIYYSDSVSWFMNASVKHVSPKLPQALAQVLP